MLSVAKQSLVCSFCRKPQSEVQKLVASPSEAVRAYICDECIAVCMSIVKEAAAETEPRPEPGHPFLDHPLASDVFATLELWIKRESLGQDTSYEISTLHSLAAQMVLESTTTS